MPHHYFIFFGANKIPKKIETFLFEFRGELAAIEGSGVVVGLSIINMINVHNFNKNISDFIN